MTDETVKEQILLALKYKENGQKAYKARNGDYAEKQYKRSIDLFRTLQQPQHVTITLANRGNDRLTNGLSDGVTDWGMAVCLATQVNEENLAAVWTYIWTNLQAHLDKKRYKVLLEGTYRCNERMTKTVQHNKYTESQKETLWLMNGMIRIVGAIGEYKIVTDPKRKEELTTFLNKASADIDAKTDGRFNVFALVAKHIPPTNLA